MITEEVTKDINNPMSHWRGLGGWNFYFLLKFALLWYGYLNFHPLPNLAFLAFLLLPLHSDRLHRCRNWIALPFGLALFYYDTWLPGIHSIMHRGGLVLDFTPGYLLELMNRIINWQMIGVAFILLVAYLFISQWIRVTVFSIIVITWLNLQNLSGPHVPNLSITTANNPPTSASPTAAALGGDQLPATDANLNAYLNEFYAKEKERYTAFPSALPQESQPFDIIIIQICSLAWSDIYAAHLEKHPLWSHFNLIFTKFNSAASYTGPAMIRLLRASCGQTKHEALYQPASPRCFLLDNLAKLGFTTEFMLDHYGKSIDLITNIREFGNLHVPTIDHNNIPQRYIAYDGEPVLNDSGVLNRWLETQKKTNILRSATFFNVTSMHDGNREIGQNSSAPYSIKGQNLFDDIDNFFTALEKSGRKAMVIVVAEHGANLSGDKMQMSGLRDIPTNNITHIPAAIKFIGMKAPYPGKPIMIDAPSADLALSELISRVITANIFNTSTVDWSALVRDLPQTAIVSENEDVVVIAYQGKFYVRLSSDSAWTPVPE